MKNSVINPLLSQQYVLVPPDIATTINNLSELKPNLFYQTAQPITEVLLEAMLDREIHYDTQRAILLGVQVVPDYVMRIPIDVKEPKAGECVTFIGLTHNIPVYQIRARCMIPTLMVVAHLQENSITSNLSVNIEPIGN